MASRLLVECIHKTDRQDAHERIKAIGGGLPGCNWRHSLEDAIVWTEDGTFVYYVINRAGKALNVFVAMNRLGHKYLKTASDSEQPDSLLNLPECP